MLPHKPINRVNQSKEIILLLALWKSLHLVQTPILCYLKAMYFIPWYVHGILLLLVFVGKNSFNYTQETLFSIMCIFYVWFSWCSA